MVWGLHYIRETMIIQLLSDLHNEKGDRFDIDSSFADIIVLSGDIDLKTNGIKWIAKQIKNKCVIYVLGNHEFNGVTNHAELLEDIYNISKHTNINVLENDILHFKGVNFLGCTLWTNYELFGNSIDALCRYEEKINFLFDPIQSISIHKESIDWLASELSARKGEINIVVTHHAPSIQSLPERYKKDLNHLSLASVSNLDSFILKYKPTYWLHGHIHNNSKYKIGNCTILCNPKGFPNIINKNFDPNFLIEI